METHFSKEQLKDQDNKSSEKIFRKCVHCGFCNATCPTYKLLGDELDGPRGRIYLIKDMLEKKKPANEKIVKHIDRCLSCYSCMTTCPSGVNYMHLIDHGRKHIEREVITFGEAGPGNCKLKYYWAMAEKRCMDRAILKAIDAYRLFYSNVELDDKVNDPAKGAMDHIDKIKGDIDDK